jgi:Cu/Ag efflux pump CusA
MQERIESPPRWKRRSLPLAAKMVLLSVGISGGLAGGLTWLGYTKAASGLRTKSELALGSESLLGAMMIDNWMLERLVAMRGVASLRSVRNVLETAASLSGMEGKMFRPLAFTKTFALLAVAGLCVTLVPALIPTFVRGKLGGEEQSFLVRSFAAVYRPVLLFLLDRPKWVVASLALLIGLGLNVKGKIGSEFMPRLDEGAILDMPVTAPGVSVPQAAADLVARDRLLRLLPEVELVVGKAGRADTPTDPAPMDMIETVINLRPREEWPRRAVAPTKFHEAARAALPSADAQHEAVARDAGLRFDARAREIALHLKAGTAAAMDDDLQSQARSLFAAALREAAEARGLRLDESRLPRWVLLARKTKSELVRELDGIAQVPGWSNIWTEPIINRVDMLSTGIRTQVGVKVFGDDPRRIQSAANDIAAVLREVPGAVDVFPDQIAGRNPEA